MNFRDLLREPVLSPVGMLLNESRDQRLLFHSDHPRPAPSMRFALNRLRLEEPLLETLDRRSPNAEKVGELLRRQLLLLPRSNDSQTEVF